MIQAYLLGAGNSSETGIMHFVDILLFESQNTRTDEVWDVVFIVNSMTQK